MGAGAVTEYGLVLFMACVPYGPCWTGTKADYMIVTADAGGEGTSGGRCYGSVIV